MLNIPQDIPRNKPCCGVACVSMLTDKTFEETFEDFRSVFRRRSHWRGSTTHDQRLLILFRYRIGYKEYSVDLFPLYKWIRDHSKENRVYMVTTTGHVQIVLNGMVYDQRHQGGIHYLEYSRRRKKIRSVVEIKGQ